MQGSRDLQQIEIKTQIHNSCFYSNSYITKKEITIKTSEIYKIIIESKFPEISGMILANSLHVKTRLYTNENFQRKAYFVTCSLQIRIISH